VEENEERVRRQRGRVKVNVSGVHETRNQKENATISQRFLGIVSASGLAIPGSIAQGNTGQGCSLRRVIATRLPPVSSLAQIWAAIFARGIIMIQEKMYKLARP
jgi:hypothetical protein